MNMTRIIQALTFCLFLVTAASGQQYVDFLNIRNDLVITNPGALSSHYLNFGNTTTISAAYKNQWMGFDASPVTYALQFRQVDEDRNIHYGITLLNDKTGAISNLSALGNIGYQLFFDRKKSKIFSLGFSAGITQYSIDIEEIQFQQSSSVNQNITRKIGAELGIGAFYADTEKFYFGISVPQFFNSTSSERQLRIDKVPHFFGQTGVYLRAPSLLFEPFVNVSYQTKAPANYMLGINANHSNGLVLGVGYNSARTPSAHFGYRFNVAEKKAPHWTAIISYGDKFASYRNILGSSLELNLSYSIGSGSSNIYCPQF